MEPLLEEHGPNRSVQQAGEVHACSVVHPSFRQLCHHTLPANLPERPICQGPVDLLNPLESSPTTALAQSCVYPTQP